MELREGGGGAVLAARSVTLDTGLSYMVIVSGYIDATRFRGDGDADNPEPTIEVYRE